MRRAIMMTTALGAALAASACATTSTTMASAEPCDRSCLIDVAEAYIDSFVAHDPTQAPLANDVVIVENAKNIEPGDGLWDTATAAPTSFAIYVPDPVVEAAGFLGVMDVEGQPSIVALRLQLENGGIVEAEHLVAGLTEEGLANLQSPRPAFTTEVPADRRMRRDELVRIAGLYYDALEGDDGSLAPFADDCMRQENGRQITSNPAAAGTEFWHRSYGCAAQLDTGVMAYIDRLDNRRVFAADPVTGLAMGLSHFRHSMTQHVFPVRGVPGITERTVANDPFDLPAAHVYKITDGKIHEIEAMGFLAPYMSPTGWER
jgi:hypothetical protein